MKAVAAAVAVAAVVVVTFSCRRLHFHQTRHRVGNTSRRVLVCLSLLEAASSLDR
jgi:hypothetical protein